jgi:hypothetical protein
MKRLLVALLGLALFAATPASAAPKASADVVKVTLRQKMLTAAAGQRITFQVALDIAPHWHLYAHGDTNFIGIDLDPDESFPLEEYEATYPAGQPGEFFGETVMTVVGKQVINAEAMVPPKLAKGVHKVRLALTVQACDDKMCLAPDLVPVELELTVK